MTANWKTRFALTSVAIAAALALINWTHLQPALAGRGDSPLPGARYDVGETDGANLIVTDNKSNTLYFYTIDRDKEVGSPLKLRGTIDLNQVGKETIEPTKAK
jgi:hypothetical protein